MEAEFFITKYCGSLNANQLKAVQTVEGPVLLLAVPGSGKTTVLVNRIGYMLFVEEIDPANILTLTYTKAATQDMKKRFESIFGNDFDGRVEFRTINGICAKIISRYGNLIGRVPYELNDDEKSISKLLTDILKKYLEDYPTESDVSGAKTLISYCKNMLLSDDEIEALGEEEDIPLLKIYREYNASLKANSQMDYDDQMVYAYTILNHSPQLLGQYRDQFRYICVDEAQDTSKIQHLIIGLLAGKGGNLFMVGDEDQSIYGFRAAYPEALLNFEKDHHGAQVLVMDRNYRSVGQIVSAADRFIQKNAERHEKHIVSTRESGNAIKYIESKSREAQFAYLLKLADGCDRETAVLYRENESAIPLVDRLERNHTPYRIKGNDMSFFTNRVVVDIVSIMQFALNPYDTDLFMRIYYKCRIFLKKEQAEQMCEISREKRIPILKAAGWVEGLNGRVLGKIKAMETNLKALKSEEPARALFRIEKPMEYGDYIDIKGADRKKLFTLRQLALCEDSIESFLERLTYLQELLRNKKTDYNCKFILSTIHSSKGLEYDRVFLMDIFDGVIPSKPQDKLDSVSSHDKKTFEEERRLFYVGMTRAKNELFIFKIQNEDSQFIEELQPVEPKVIEIASKPVARKISASGISGLQSQIKGTPQSDHELVIGERVISKRYGAGVIENVQTDEKGKQTRFVVVFDEDDIEKTFAFPQAFVNDMSLESGETVNINYVTEKRTATKPTVKAATGDKNTYEYWSNAFPNHVVIKKEGSFWTCRGNG